MGRFLSSYRGQIKLILLPYLIGTLVLTVIPAVLTVAVAFTDWNTIGSPNWVGLDNFFELTRSEVVRESLWSTLIFVVMAIPLRLFTALGLAVLLQRRSRLFGMYRAMVYLPTVIPETAYALIWLWVFNPIFGPLNMVLTWLGVPAPAWVVEAETARLALVILMTFQVGEGFVVLLAALQTVPRSLYDAAYVDGAGAFASFRRITLPLIMPYILLITFRDLILALQNTFTPSFVITYGGPYYATTFVPLLIYEIAFDLFEYGLAAALVVLVYVVTGIIVWGIWQVVSTREAWDAV